MCRKRRSDARQTWTIRLLAARKTTYDAADRTLHTARCTPHAAHRTLHTARCTCRKSKCSTLRYERARTGNQIVGLEYARPNVFCEKKDSKTFLNRM